MNRRELLRRAGAAGLAVTFRGVALPEIAGAATKLPLTPEATEGPYYVALDKLRKNITLGKKGVPLRLRLTVETTAGKPIKNAACDIWHCDATGAYSDEAVDGTAGQTFLRGTQVTDSKGVTEFITIYPGFYEGRTTHIHVKVHTGGHVSHTGQLFFPESLSNEVYAGAPYNTETATRTHNDQDTIFEQQGGARTVLKLTKQGRGYLGAITLVVNPAATPAKIGA